MELKKSERADLENKKGLFFQIGLVITLLILLVAFEWSGRPRESIVTGQLNDMYIDEEIVPITRQPQEPAIPPPPQVVEQLNIVEDNVQIDEVDFENMEADANMKMDISKYNGNEEEEIEEEYFYTTVEEMPKFRGKDKDEFRNFITENFIYPRIAVQNRIQGTVYIQFAVNSSGDVCDVAILKGVDELLDNESIRIVKSSPKWTPGKQRGRPVKVQFIFPINFKLD